MRIALALALLSAPTTAHAQLDVDAALSHVRPEHRATLEAELGAPPASLPGYDLHLSIAADLHGFGLREVVEVTNDESAPMRDVVLRIFVNATPPEGMGPQVTLVDGGCLDGVSCAVEATGATSIRVVPEQPLAPGARLRVRLDLTGLLQPIEPERTGMLAQGLEGMSAFESGSSAHGYGLLSHDGTTATLASFFPVVARRVSGRWIEDDHGTTGDLGTDAMSNVHARVVVPRGCVVASSGEAVRRRGVRDPAGSPPREEVTIEAGAIRDFALVVGETLEVAERDVNGVTVRSIFVPAHRDAGERVLDHAAHALEIYERRFGPYPYTALDVAEAPLVGGAGGVEFSSFVTVASMFYGGAGEGLGEIGDLLSALGGDATGGMDLSSMTESMLEFVTAHEVAHQWWHGIVGSDSRVSPVTDESLAQWSSVLYIEERYGPARARTEAERQVAMNYVMMRVNGLPDAPADQPVSAYDPPVAYAGIVYGKAPFLWLRLRTLLGDDAFFAGIQAYVARYRMREAPADGLIDLLAGAADRRTAREVRRIARRFLHERHGDDDLGPITEERMMASMLGGDAGAMGGASGPMRTLLRALAGGGLGDLDPSDLAGMLGGGDSEEVRRMLSDALGEGGLGDFDPEAAGALLEGMGEGTGEGTGEGEAPPRGPGPTRIE